MTQLRRAPPCGEQMTIWNADCCSARVSVSPRFVAVASSSRSRNTGAKRSGTGPNSVSRPTRCFGTRYVSSALCSHVAHSLVGVAVADEGPVLELRFHHPLNPVAPLPSGRSPARDASGSTRACSSSAASPRIFKDPPPFVVVLGPVVLPARVAEDAVHEFVLLDQLRSRPCSWHRTAGRRPAAGRSPSCR